MKYDFYKKKLRILESFYMGIVQGYNYTVATGQCLEYNRPQNDLDEIIIPITIATRYARCDREMGNLLKVKIHEAIKKAKLIDLDEYGLSEGELKVYNEELREIELLIKM